MIEKVVTRAAVAERGVAPPNCASLSILTRPRRYSRRKMSPVHFPHCSFRAIDTRCLHLLIRGRRSPTNGKVVRFDSPPPVRFPDGAILWPLWRGIKLRSSRSLCRSPRRNPQSIPRFLDWVRRRVRQSTVGVPWKRFQMTSSSKMYDII